MMHISHWNFLNLMPEIHYPFLSKKPVQVKKKSETICAVVLLLTASL